MNNKTKVSFFLLGEKGLSVLQKIIELKYNPDFFQVVYAEDKHLNNDYSQEIVTLCTQHSIRCFNRSGKFPEAEYSVAIGWRWLIDNNHTTLIVFHDSLLPKYRGFAPLVNMLINGESKIGATVLYAGDSYDVGPIIFQESKTISYPIRIQTAIEIISMIYASLAAQVIEGILAESLPKPVPQNENNASYSLWRDENDYLIDWDSNASRIKRMVDAVGSPYKGAKSYLNSVEITVEEVEEVIDLNVENRDVGKVIFMNDGMPTVVCGEGLIKITKARYTDQTSIIPLSKFRSRFGK